MIPFSSLPSPPLSSVSALCSERKRIEKKVGLAALHALYFELAAYPKPGLVSFVDSGSHHDMNAATFFRSLFSLRCYFPAIARAGMEDLPFAALNALGRAAEERMEKATGGINTHRGAIFNIGLLAAAAGRLLAGGYPLTGKGIQETIRGKWGEILWRLGRIQVGAESHGQEVRLRFGVGGAREEAANGFPHVFDVGLPVYGTSLIRGAAREEATLQCFFHLLAVLPDTNLLYRGGEEGLAFAKASAREFLEQGGVHRPGWREHARIIHKHFIDRNLSPGGSADLLAACLFVHSLLKGDGSDRLMADGVGVPV